MLTVEIGPTEVHNINKQLLSRHCAARRRAARFGAGSSPSLTRRAASTAQSTRLLLRSDLVCVLWSVRGLGSASSSCCWFTFSLWNRRFTLIHGTAAPSAKRALWYREGGECWAVRPRMIYVPPASYVPRSPFISPPSNPRGGRLKGRLAGSSVAGRVAGERPARRLSVC